MTNPGMTVKIPIVYLCVLYLFQVILNQRGLFYKEINILKKWDYQQSLDNMPWDSGLNKRCSMGISVLKGIWNSLMCR